MAIRDWNPQSVVNTTTTGSQYQPVVAGLRDGSYVVAWLDLGQVKYQKFSAAGVKVGAENTLPLADGNGSQSHLSIASLPGTGGFVMTMVDTDPILVGGDSTEPDVTIARFDANGNVLGQEQVLSRISPHVTAAPGGYTVAYTQQYSPGNSDVFFETYDNDGNFQFSRQIEESVGNADSSAEVILEGFEVHAIYETRGGMQGSSVGTYSPNTFLFIDLGNISFFAPPNSDDDFSNMALIGPNRVAVVTSFGLNSSMSVEISQGGQPYVEIPNFRPIGSNPKITALDDSSFVVSWDATDVSGNRVIRLQQFDNTGNKIGFEATLGDNGTATNEDVGLAVLADGRLVVTWQETSGSGDGNSTGILHQIVDTREGIVTGSNDASVSETLYGNNLSNDLIKGLAGNDTLHGLSGADTIFGGNGNDTLHGGRGDDTLFGGADQDSLLGGLGADEIDGGDGVDTANYALASFAVTVSLDGTLEGTSEAFGDTYISVENLTGSNIAAQGDTLRGDAAANTMAGLAGNDFINAVGGHDRITGGAGIDTMTGGIGSDSFIYNTLSEGSDIIADFSSFAANNDDVLRFKGSVFGGLAAGNITAAQFQSSTADVAGTANVRFLYETDTRILRFDADGSGAGAAVTIATLQVGATMSVSDILIF